jgi:hypothetical protein
MWAFSGVKDIDRHKFIKDPELELEPEPEPT